MLAAQWLESVATELAHRVHFVWIKIRHDAGTWIAWWVRIADPRPLAFIQVPDYLVCIIPQQHQAAAAVES